MWLAGTQKPLLGAQINWAHPLSRGLVGCWIFNEGCGDIVADASGHGNTDTLTGMAFPATVTSGWNPGRTGVALNFDGIDDYVDCGNDVMDFAGNKSFSVSLWMKTTYSADDNYMVATGLNDGFYIRTDEDPGNHALFIKIDDGINDAFEHEATTPLNDGKWYHIVMTSDAINILGYVNANKEIEFSVGSVGNLGNYLLIGAGANLSGGSINRLFNGSIDEVRIYNRALSAQEIQQLYYAPYAMFEPSYEVAMLYAPIAPPAVGVYSAMNINRLVGGVFV